MDLDTLARLSKGSDLAVLVAMVRAHADGVATVAPAALMAACDESDYKLAKRLARMAEAGMVERITTKKVRITRAGCQLVGADPEILRLTSPRTPNNSEMTVDNSDGTPNYSEITAVQEVGIIPTWRIDTVSLHRELGNIRTSCTNSEKFGLPATDCVIDIKSHSLKTSNQSAEAGRLFGILKARTRNAMRRPAMATLEKLLEGGARPEAIERDILGHSAYVMHEDNKRATNKAGYVVKQLTTGNHAGLAEREYLARGQPGGEAYAGYLGQGPEIPPDLQRFDELTERLGATV